MIIIENNTITIKKGRRVENFKFDSQEAFIILSKLWLRCGWDTKYVYTFSWLGRPIIQLPEDLLRIQEVIYQIKPDVIIETGIAHGGSLVFYANICHAIGKGRVIGIDIEIRQKNRKAIESHELFPYISLIEGDSIDNEIVHKVKQQIQQNDTVLIMLDSNHSKAHVLAELNAYATMVSPGSYIVAADGIMKDLVGAPRSNPDWAENNPFIAVQEFLKNHSEFILETPRWLFNESNGLSENVTYWPGAWLKRVR